MPRQGLLSVRMLGEIEISRGTKRLPLPQSKKTRALLVYLVVTGRPHRRDRLCSLLWDVADDPRGALRWSLSKLRAVVDEPAIARIVADRETVGFERAGAWIDLFAVRDLLAGGLRDAKTEQLEQAAALYRGELFEGLDLSDFHDFQAWCIAEREKARTGRAALLRELVERLAPKPDDALPHASALVAVDPLDERAHARLVLLLDAAGRRAEAELQCESSARLLTDLGARPARELEQARRRLAEKRRPAAAEAGAAAPTRGAALEPAPPSTPPTVAPLVGRRSELARMTSALGDVAARRQERILLVTGEPGAGKSRLLAELIRAAHAQAGTVMDGCAYEAESGRPYGPWIDALRRLPATAVGKPLGTELAPLLPELPHDGAAERTRERLFGGVVDLIAALAHSMAPVLLAFDDVQWCDAASAELLHYAARMNHHRPVLIALTAREGELPDNGPMHRVVLALRREGLLEEVRLGPLSLAETVELVRGVAPAADGKRVFDLTAGNPMFALEASRADPEWRDGVPPTLARLVRERIERLPPTPLEVVRWCAVMGPAAGVRALGELTSIGPQLVPALESLERNALMREAPKALRARGDYVFAHDVVRRVIYAELSEPRRQLMHRRVAQVLDALVGGDETTAGDIAHHAALGGDASMAARACVSAGRRCLRLFANSEAERLVGRGARYAASLKEPERVQRMIELAQISSAARRPDRPAEAAKQILALAERALDYGCAEHARIAFHILSYLHWEEGQWSDAERNIMRAEQVSRSGGDERERVLAMAEAARCLTLLERDLALAERMVLQAGVLSARLEIQAAAIPDAEGMLRLHEGLLDEASTLFAHARLLARSTGHRLDEFHALEHLVMVELERGLYDRAVSLAEDLVAIGDKLREGSEAPFARALSLLARYATGSRQTAGDLERALESLRIADAKHRLAYVLTRAAAVDLETGGGALARRWAAEALEIAGTLERPSEIALARAVLMRAAAAANDLDSAARYREELERCPLDGASVYARRTVRALIAKP